MIDINGPPEVRGTVYVPFAIPSHFILDLLRCSQSGTPTNAPGRQSFGRCSFLVMIGKPAEW